MSAPCTIEAEHLRHGYGRVPVLEGVSLTVRPGDLVAIVGPNGAGKSTLLRLLLGFLQADAGAVHLMGDPVGGLARREVAKRAAFVPQGAGAHFAFTVREMVAMGRTPWLGRFRPETARDREAIAKAMRAADVDRLEERAMPELSGGERQRVLLARAFAQGTPLLVLDEPNANLDLRHSLDLLGLVRKRVDEGAAAVAALHDLTLAARFATRVAALHRGRIVADGPPREVLTPNLLAEVFRVHAHLAGDPPSLVMDE